MKKVKQKTLFFLLIIIFLTPLIYSRFHPALKWKEISGKNFIVIYPRGYKSIADKTLRDAGVIYAKLIKLWGNAVSGKIRILLNPSIDDANGSATFFPFNLVEIQLFDPLPDSTIGSYDNWIHLVLAHELTHIINFNNTSRFLEFFRRIAGSNPILYSFGLAPIWVIEGAAVFGESYISEYGRMHTPDFAIMLSCLAEAKKIPDCRRIFGDPTAWPGPQSKYLFGAKFFQFLHKKYGAAKIKEFVAHYAKCPLPVFIKDTVWDILRGDLVRWDLVYNKRIDVLWNEFIASIDRTNFLISPQVKPLTTGGLLKKYPLGGDNNKVYFVYNTYKDLSTFVEMDLKTGKRKKLFKKAKISGVSYAEQEKRIYFSANNYYRIYYWYADLYYYDLVKEKVIRLTKGERLLSPLKVKRKIYCVKRVRDKSFLAVLHPGEKKAEIISRSFDSLAYLDISKDKKFIAASLKLDNMNWGIGVFNLQGNLIRVILNGKKKLYFPKYRNKDELFFITEYKNKYCLGSCHTEKNIFHLYNDSTLPAIKYFSFIPRHDNLLIQFYGSRGYDIGLLNLKDLNKEPINLTVRENRDFTDPQPTIRENNSEEVKERGYRSWRELIPKYFTLSYRNGGKELQPGIYLHGNDAVMNHQYSLGLYYGFSTNSSNFDFNYSYNGLMPTLSFDYNQFTDLNYSSDNQEYNQKRRLFKFSCLYPIYFKNKTQAYFLSNIHFDRIKNHFLTTGESDETILNGLGVGIFLNTVKKYYDSISNSDGLSMSFSYARELKALGSDFNVNVFAAEYKHYITLFRPNVLAFRVCYADSWGDGRRIFNMGGIETQPRINTAESNMFTLMRGFPKGYFWGTGGWLFNIEYRVSLFKIEYSYSVLESMERMYLTFFTDIGNVWFNERKISPSCSFGVELNMITFIVNQKLNLAGGCAIGTNPDISPKLTFYLRIGSSF